VEVFIMGSFYVKTFVGTILLILFIQGASAQNFDDDPEVADIGARVLDVTWEFDEHSNNESSFHFNITLELWNPYDNELVSYGSSSCRWPAWVTFSSTEFEIQNSLLTCTADLAPRKYPSGLSNEQSHPDLLFVNSLIDLIPDGILVVNGKGGTYDNSTDNFYGAKVVVTNDTRTVEFEPLPDNWGNILFTHEKSDGNFELSAPNVVIVIFTIIIIWGRRKSINLQV
jgi:hypothetical protein